MRRLSSSDEDAVDGYDMAASGDTVLHRIARLTKYEWAVHQAIHRGQDMPATPRNQPSRDLSG